MEQLSSVDLTELGWVVKLVEPFHRKPWDNLWHQQSRNPKNTLRLYLRNMFPHIEYWHRPKSIHSNCSFRFLREREEEDSHHYKPGMNLPPCMHRRYFVGQNIPQETTGCQR
jgi:hypothetical protein